MHDLSNTSLTVAAVQFACTSNVSDNLSTALRMVREAAAKGAQIICVQELFETLYFCQEQNPAHFGLATSIADNPAVNAFQMLCKDLSVVVPVSIFERAGQAFYNTVVMIDADGAILGTYRKSHIPDGPGYSEKYYFRQGDSGFKVWATAHGKVGVGICWDQWFPEAARAMALLGAEILLYPTAIGSEPGQPDFDSMEHWRTVMRGHAGANMMPVIASNRIGTEVVAGKSQTYYGSSFIAGPDGALLADGPRNGECVLTHSFGRQKLVATRAAWGLFRDRRPDLYGVLLTADGEQ